ncbi:MAG: acetone carboxylase subunit gamma [Dehalococcoidia bacterium]|nr:acetone carboxylase subunit gamma [Dehalococcoidia bacterium]
MKQRVGEYLEIDDSSPEPVLQCRKCKHTFCPPNGNFKAHALISERPLNGLGPMYSDTERFVFREFYCPGCATLLCVDMTLKGSPILWDTQLKV